MDAFQKWFPRTSLSCETPAKGSEVAYCWSNRSSSATSGSLRKHFDGACFKWGFNFQLLNHQQQQQQQQVPFGKWLNESYVELKFARLKLSNSIYPPSPFLFDFPQGFSSPVWFRKTENKLNLSSSLSLSLSLLLFKSQLSNVFLCLFCAHSTRPAKMSEKMGGLRHCELATPFFELSEVGNRPSFCFLSPCSLSLLCGDDSCQLSGRCWCCCCERVGFCFTFLLLSDWFACA